MGDRFRHSALFRQPSYLQSGIGQSTLLTYNEKICPLIHIHRCTKIHKRGIQYHLRSPLDQRNTATRRVIGSPSSWKTSGEMLNLVISIDVHIFLYKFCVRIYLITMTTAHASGILQISQTYAEQLVSDRIEYFHDTELQQTQRPPLRNTFRSLVDPNYTR